MEQNIKTFLHEFQYLNRNLDNHQLSLEQLDEIFMQCESKKPLANNLSINETIALKNIYQSLYIIDNLLKPFRDFGIPYELGITGGAVYDFLTGNSDITKDYDIVLHFPIAKGNTSSLGNINEPNFNYFNLPQDEFKKIKMHIRDEFQPLVKKMFQTFWNDDNPINRINRSGNNEIFIDNQGEHIYQLYDLAALVNHIIRPLLHITHSYQQNNLEQEPSYSNRIIDQLIKINDSSFAKPVDLIIAQFNTNYLAATFDFNICNTYINYRTGLSDNNDLAHVGFSLDNMLKHLFISPEAAKDLQNKTYTMDTCLSEPRIEYFMTRHYPRLVAKLPDYDLEFKYDTNNNALHLLAQDYKRLHLHNKLQNKIVNKEDTLVKKLKI